MIRQVTDVPPPPPFLPLTGTYKCFVLWKHSLVAEAGRIKEFVSGYLRLFLFILMPFEVLLCSKLCGFYWNIWTGMLLGLCGHYDIGFEAVLSQHSPLKTVKTTIHRRQTKRNVKVWLKHAAVARKALASRMRMLARRWTPLCRNVAIFAKNTR